MNAWPWFLVGGAVGLAHFLSLRWTIERAVPRWQNRAWLSLGVGSVLRLLLVAGILLLAVRQGLVEVLLAFLGFWIIRWPLLYWYNKRSKAPSESSKSDG